MKKVVVLFVAVMLALPAMSYAGSATSRWDLTIGGMVKMDIMYGDQSSNQDITYAERESATNTSSRDKYGATSWGAGESRLNFLVKGPDTWGAKTSAFIEGDFRSLTSNSVSASSRNSVEDYGLFNLRHAFMKFDWPTFSVVIGRTWSVPGNQPCFCLLGVNEIGSFNKGILDEQIYGVWQATKNFSVTAGIMAPYSTNSWPGGTLANGAVIDDGFQRSNWPMIFTELLYKTDACGKIGPWMLQFAVGGVYGKERPIEPADFGPVGNIGTQGATSGTSLNTVSNMGVAGVSYVSANGYDSNTVDMWMLTARTFIPIIPEKAPGKLANSLGLSLSGFTGQDMRRFAGAPPFVLGTYEYDRAAVTMSSAAQLANPTANYVAPVNTGGWGQLMYYWTDTVWTGVYYGQNRTSLSQWRKNTISAGAIERQQEWHVNLVYDPNPAIRLGIEYSWYDSHYARNLYVPGTYNWGTAASPIIASTNGLTSDGKENTVRFSAQYFF